MHIIFYSPDSWSVFFPNTGFVFGGIEVETGYYATGLSKKGGVEVTVITKDQGFGSRKAGMVKVVPHPVIKGTGYWDKRSSLRGRIKARLTRERSTPLKEFYTSLKADVFFVQGPSPEAITILNYCKENGLPFIFRLASDYDIGGANGEVNVLESWTHMKFADVSRLITECDLLLVQSQLQKDVCRKYFDKSGEVIYNPIAVPKDPLEVARDIDVLWVGKNSTIKRPELFLKIAAAIPDAKCVFVCNNVDQGSWDKLVVSVPSNVLLIESVPFDQMHHYFARAKVFVNTSETEGFANTFLQACVAKVPIVSFNSDPEGLLSEIGAGRLVAGNFELAIQEIKALIANPARHSTIGLKGWSYVMQNHESDTVVSQLFRMIDTITSK